MIRYTNASGEQYPLSSYEEFYVRHMMDGCDMLRFCVDVRSPEYPMLLEECRVETDGNYWLVKKIEDDEITCSLDFDFLKKQVYFQYLSERRTLSEVLEDHLPDDWTVEGANVSSVQRTISFPAATDFEVIYACQNTYDVCFL